MSKDRPEQHRTSADFARYLVLMAPRRGQGTALRFSHIDFDNDRMVMPASTSKDHKSFVRPISPPLRELLLHRLEVHRRLHEDQGQEVPADGGVFPSSRSKCGHLVGCRGTLNGTEDIAPRSRRRPIASAWRVAG